MYVLGFFAGYLYKFFLGRLGNLEVFIRNDKRFGREFFFFLRCGFFGFIFLFFGLRIVFFFFDVFRVGVF